MSLSIVVLAAGQGKRMHSDLPKVLQPLAGRPLLAHVLDTARALQPSSVHVVYGHGGDEVRAAFPDADLVWCRQAEQLGTGHAVMQGMPGIADDHTVVVLCGDVPLVGAGTALRLTHTAEDGRLALLTAELDDPHGYGRVVRDERGRVARIVEEKDATDDERRLREINTGLLAVRARELRRWLSRLDNDNAQGEYYLTDIIAMAVADAVPVEGVLADDAAEVLGINDRAQLAAAERILQRRIARALLQSGVTLADPERLDVRGAVDAGRDVFIDVGVVLEGNVRLEDGVRIGPYCVISNSTLGAGSVVHSHSVLDGIRTGAGCEIGPFARVRPSTELDAKVKIGNFVEVKNSRAAAGAKMNHLSYIGDTTLGSGVNVGAGTITCNYDGANKHRTVIGDGAFIGSNTALVAPVEVGAGATIGAGSTITKDAPPNELTVARPRQQTITGWKRPTKQSRPDQPAAEAKPSDAPGGGQRTQRANGT